MPVNYLYLNNKKISYEEIKAGTFVGNTPFEQVSLSFCRQWLNEQASFNLKTSGSTGEPKSIEVSRQQITLSARQTITYFSISPVDTVLVCLNTAYIAGIMMLARAMESGANIIAIEPTGNPLQDIDQQIEFMAVVPLQLQQILANTETKKRLAQCRAVIVGGAPVSVKLSKLLEKSTAKVYATFGMTETLTHFALQQLNPTPEDFFTTFQGVTIGQDTRGCLTVTSEVTKDVKLVTNDLVEILALNTFKWLGRIDNVINSGGVKLQIEDLERKVEEAFYGLALTNRFFVIGKHDDVLGEMVTLVIESLEELAVLRNLDWSNYLAKYEIPKDFLNCSQFIETPTGKIKRRETLQLCLSEGE
jgi:o-succinylbenzoate---CoA ligase